MKKLSASERAVLREQARQAARAGQWVALDPDLLERMVDDLDSFWSDEQPVTALLGETSTPTRVRHGRGDSLTGS